MNPQPGEVWQHYKTQGEYEILGLGKLQVKDGLLDMQDSVVYKSKDDSKIRIRPQEDFLEIVVNEAGEEVPRFTKVS